MKIWFNSNNGDHKALFHNEVSSKEFQSYDEAVAFWLECTSPITELKEFIKNPEKELIKN